MDPHMRFNRRAVGERQIDTLIGISKGLVADGVVNQAEAEFLATWLIQAKSATSHPIISNLLTRVGSMLEDNVLDEEESTELMSTLRSITGDESVMGELSKPGNLPLCTPPPAIEFPGRSFLFTGTFVYGTRRECQATIDELGGTNASGVTKSLNYLVIGSYVTDSWAHETFGRKIEKAMAYRDSGVPLRIVSEAHWTDSTSKR